MTDAAGLRGRAVSSFAALRPRARHRVERRAQGWSKIMVTHGGDHPYVGNWWPDAHIIGYEHGFINMAADMLNIIAGKPPVPVTARALSDEK